jgi:hypothetical protein
MGAIAALAVSANAKKYEKTVIEIYNPLNIEMKYNWSSKKFRHYKFSKLNRRNKTANNSEC